MKWVVNIKKSIYIKISKIKAYAVKKALDFIQNKD